MTRVLKSTSKGQITLPKTWRSQFATDHYLLEVEGQKVIITPLSFKAGKEKEEVIFDADLDNNGKGVSVDEMIKMLKQIRNG